MRTRSWATPVPPRRATLPWNLGFATGVTDTAAEAVLGADLVVLAVPVGAMQSLATEIGPHLMQGATVTDVGSVKQAVIDAVAPHMPSGSISFPATPSRGPSTPVRGRVFRRCFAIGGGC